VWKGKETSCNWGWEKQRREVTLLTERNKEERLRFLFAFLIDGKGMTFTHATRLYKHLTANWQPIKTPLQPHTNTLVLWKQVFQGQFNFLKSISWAEILHIMQFCMHMSIHYSPRIFWNVLAQLNPINPTSTLIMWLFWLVNGGIKEDKNLMYKVTISKNIKFKSV